MNGSSFAVEHLSVTFRDHPAVVDVSFAIERGEIFALVGESGSGKTATALACLGLLPATARVSGAIQFDTLRYDAADANALAGLRGTHVSMIFQNPGTAFNPLFRIGDQIRAVVEQHSERRGEGAREHVMALLARVCLVDPTSAACAFPHQLSGGQLQRAMIALALSCGSRLLIADEPTTALDVTVQAQLLALLAALAREERLSILFITHDLSVVGALCDRVGVMQAGRIVEEGPVARLLATPAHPYTQSLLAAVPRFELNHV
jgi:ABC-type dipeptide/oligopeptide/nickel transport system ATPase component